MSEENAAVSAVVSSRRAVQYQQEQVLFSLPRMDDLPFKVSHQSTTCTGAHGQVAKYWKQGKQ